MWLPAAQRARLGLPDREPDRGTKRRRYEEEEEPKGQPLVKRVRDEEAPAPTSSAPSSSTESLVRLGGLSCAASQ